MLSFALIDSNMSIQITAIIAEEVIFINPPRPTRKTEQDIKNHQFDGIKKLTQQRRMTRPRSKTRWRPIDRKPAPEDAFTFGLFANPPDSAEKLIIISDTVVELGGSNGDCKVQNC